MCAIIKEEKTKEAKWVTMPNYYLAVVRVGEGCEVDREGKLEHWDLPAYYGFSEENARKLHPGDMLVDYVAPNWGFASVLRVEEEPKPKPKPKPDPDDPHRKWPWHVKVKVLCELRDKNMMPKWEKLWENLNWTKRKDMSRMSPNGANGTLQTSLKEIDEHDYKLIETAICDAAKRTTPGRR